MDKQQLLDMNNANIEEFRSSHGRIGSFGDAPVLLLTTTGAKSGQRRTSPMMYRADGQDSDRIFVFASYAGADVNPAWFHNLVAHPDDVEVEIGDDHFDATATVLAEGERAEVYAAQAGEYPGFAEYQEKTSRIIPVVALALAR